MAARDRWTKDLKCPKCGKTGTAEVSEADYPFMRSPDFTVDSIDDGFVVTKYAETSAQTVIECTGCKVPVK